jgi:hypothetical protein
LSRGCSTKTFCHAGGGEGGFAALCHVVFYRKPGPPVIFFPAASTNVFVIEEQPTEENQPAVFFF